MNKFTRVLLVFLPALSLECGSVLADELDCENNKVKTCFMDGKTTSCVCVDPASTQEISDPQVPADYDPEDEYTGELE